MDISQLEHLSTSGSAGDLPGDLPDGLPGDGLPGDELPGDELPSGEPAAVGLAGQPGPASRGGGRRARGAQPGNRNALKHGLYSRSFRRQELADLQRVQAGLANEIAMLRVVQNRLLACAGDFDRSPEQIDLKTAISLLQALGATSMRIAALVKAQAGLGGGDSEIRQALDAALRVVNQEFGVMR